MSTHENILILKGGAVCLLLTVARVSAPVLYSLVLSPHPASFATFKILLEAGDKSWYFTLSKLSYQCSSKMGPPGFEAPGSHTPSNIGPGGSVLLEI